MTTATKSEDAEKLKVNEQKWSAPLMAAGWTAIPSIIIERQKAIGLDAIDIAIIMHLAVYWWTADSKPHPSKKTIADALDVDPRTVQRRIARMEAAKFIKRQERRVAGRGSKTNIYHLDGLIEAAQPYAAEKLEEIAARAEERRARNKRKRARIRLVKPEEDE